MHENETLSVLMYFFNKFNQDECYKLWGDGPYSLGEHLFNKYQNYVSTYGAYGAPLMFLFALDSINYQKVIDRACELYNGRQNRK